MADIPIAMLLMETGRRSSNFQMGKTANCNSTYKPDSWTLTGSQTDLILNWIPCRQDRALGRVANDPKRVRESQIDHKRFMVVTVSTSEGRVESVHTATLRGHIELN